MARRQRMSYEDAALICAAVSVRRLLASDAAYLGFTISKVVCKRDRDYVLGSPAGR
jgi:hypothetical protein